MANKIVREIIHAKGIDIGIYTKDFENEYISLTDIAKYRNDKLDKMNMVRNPENIGRRKKYTKEQLDKAIKLLDEHSYLEVSEITGISTATILRKKRLREEQESKE